MKGRAPRNYDKPQGPMVLGLDAVLTVTEGHEADPSVLRPPEVALVALIDGKKTVEEVLQHSQTSWFVAMRRLRSLCERGILEPVKSGDDASSRARRTAPDRSSSADESRPRVTLDLTDIVSKLAPVPSANPPEGVPGAAVPAGPLTAPGFTPMAGATNKTNPGGQGAAEPGGLPVTGVQTSLVPPSIAAAAASGGTISKLHGAQATALAPPDDEEPATPPPAVQTAPPVLDGTSAAEGGVVAAPASAAGSGAVGAGRPKRMKPFKLGRYEVVTRIGQGGMGSVYLCRQPGHWGFQRLFTLKVIREHAAGDREAMSSFLREARIGGLLSHPNILGVVDVGNYKGQPFLVMDYVEGASLSDLLNLPTPPPPQLVVPVLLDTLRGLQSAHEQVDARGTPLGIVHCDVSPHNIMVGLDGAARITDFGSARLSGQPIDGEHEELPAVGKPGYMGPEQLCGNPIDGRTDVFAMGIVMWTALTGRKLFTDPSYEQTIINVLRKRVEPPSVYGSPPALDEVCMKALQRAPEARFQSAEEMRLALHRVASREGMIASNAEVGRWVRRLFGDALEERRKRILSAFGEPEETTGESSVRGLEAGAPKAPGAGAPAGAAAAGAAPPAAAAPTVVGAAPAQPPAKTTILLPRELRNRGGVGAKTIRLPVAEATQTLNMQYPELFDDAQRRRRAWMVVAAVAVGSALTVLVAQALLGGGDRRVKRRPRPGTNYSVPTQTDNSAPRPPGSSLPAPSLGTSGSGVPQPALPGTSGGLGGRAGDQVAPLTGKKTNPVVEVERRSPTRSPVGGRSSAPAHRPAPAAATAPAAGSSGPPAGATPGGPPAPSVPAPPATSASAPGGAPPGGAGSTTPPSLPTQPPPESAPAPSPAQPAPPSGSAPPSTAPPPVTPPSATPPTTPPAQAPTNPSSHAPPIVPPPAPSESSAIAAPPQSP
jgi:eukaryotic-like serine/threonine-protein kinase